ncbi:hypothetical protein BBJ28_00017780 [Nothophytophthora sp. Chile5]|nr:hypothetical protein BBJ28_00017780 [Nothophytophthora sp. Chile5]
MPRVRVAPKPRRESAPEATRASRTRRGASSSNVTDDVFLYRLEAPRSLPVIDLRRTLSHRLLHPEQNLQLLWWLKKYFAVLNLAFQLGTALTLAVVACPREIGRILGPVAALLSVMAVVSSLLTVSLDMLALLTRQYEFWFFSLTNLVAWVLLAFFLGDALRIVSLIPLWLGLQLIVALDANFRTFVTAVRSSVIVLLALLVIAALAFVRAIDTDQTRLEQAIPLPAVASVSLPLLGLFINTLMTLILFVLRTIYNKRKLLEMRSGGSKIVRCQLFRSQLVLRPVRYPRTATMDVNTSSRIHVLQKQLGISAPVMTIASANDTAQHHQQITLVALRLSAVDSRKMLLQSWSLRRSERLPIAYLLALYTAGAAGLALSVATLTLPSTSTSTSSVETQPSDLQMAVPATGFVLSVAFVTVFACASQREILHALLLRNFAFLFALLHFSLACLCMADMLSWDYRCWAVAAAFLWFHWVQLLDALAPPVRRQLAFSKTFVAPVLVVLCVAMAVIVYASVMLPTDRSGLRGRELLRFQVGQHVAVLDTKSMLISRLFTILFWMQRLVWDVICDAFSRFRRLLRRMKTIDSVEDEQADEEELSVMRGSLEYFCPFDTFPGVRRRLSSLRMPVSSLSSLRRTSLTGRHRVRRLDSTTLLSGLIVSDPEKRRRTRRGAFGQPMHPAPDDREARTRTLNGEHLDYWAEAVPGAVSPSDGWTKQADPK